MACGRQEKVRVGADATCTVVKRVVNVGLTHREWLACGTKRAETGSRFLKPLKCGKVDLNGEDAFQASDEGSPLVVVCVQPRATRSDAPTRKDNLVASHRTAATCGLFP